jgi:serine/threonine-protein kinase HipA
MITSEPIIEAFVWVWLPEVTKPVVAGKLQAIGDTLQFNYGKSYLERVDGSHPAIALSPEELPLQSGLLPLLAGLNMPGCLRDAAPDAWGRRVIMNRLLGSKGSNADTAELQELTYLLFSGSDRIGAFDFQQSPTEYQPRSAENASLEELLESAERVQKGIPLQPELDQALLHGSSIGGARPKALIENNDVKYIAKFSISSDLYSVVKAEYVAMRLAELVGLNVAQVKLTRSANKDVLLVERFDREYTPDGWTRKMMISALSLLKLDEMHARYASYEDLAEIVRHRFINPKDTLKELFSRMVFNILCGNTDDHARNHAAFWDGGNLSLTPAYDICPQGRTGNEASQGMLISGINRSSQLQTCLNTAHNFLFSTQDAENIFDTQICLIKKHWNTVCNEAELSIVDKNLLWERQFLNSWSIAFDS